MRISIDEHSLPRIQRWGMMALAVLLTLLLGGHFIFANVRSHQDEGRKLEAELLRQQEMLIESQVQEVGNYLEHVRSRTEQVLKAQIRDQVTQALQTLEAIHAQQQGRMKEADLRRLLAETLRPVRFLGGRGYYFIDDLAGNCILLPIAPEREGTSLLDNRDDQGTYIMRELIKAVDNPAGAGFASYRWYAPGRKSMDEKIAYAQVFKPYGWIVGTGEYLFKIEQDLQEEALARIRSLRFGQHGYIAVLNRDGTPLLAPSRPRSENQPLATLAEPEQEVIRRIIRKASEGGGIVHYDWINPRTGKIAPKMSYVLTVPEWNWIVVGGVYLDDIQATLAEREAHLDREIGRSILAGLVVLLLACLVALVFSAFYSRWFKGLFQRYQQTIDAHNQALEANNQALYFNKFVLDHAGDLFLLLDAGQSIRYANRAACHFFGRDEAAMLGSSTAGLGLPQLNIDQPGRDSDQREILVHTPDGREATLEVDLSRADYQGTPYYCAILRDISQRKEDEKRLHLAAHVFESGQEAMMVTDGQNRVLAVNSAFTRITGYTAEEIQGRDPNLLKSGRHSPEFYEAIWHHLGSEGSWSGEIWNRRKDGSVYPVWLTLTRILDSHGQASHFIAAFVDISDKKATEDRIRYLAEYDALTDLPNRSLLSGRLEQAILHARKTGSALAVLWIDLDRFKNINDSLGHAIGDQFLVETARRLIQEIRARDTVSRASGDEFVVVLNDLDNADQAANVARKLLELVGRNTRLGDKELTVTPSIGIALYPDDGSDGDTLLRNAEAAMYHAKQLGRNNCQFFTAAINERFNERLVLENGLRQALAQGHFQLHYQPQFDLDSRRLVGCEALLRWTSPELGSIPPVRFIPVAEESGLIEAIGDWVLQEACRQVADWQARGLDPCPVAVNVSAVQFRNGSILHALDEALARTAISPALLELEVTESVLAEDAGRITQQLEALKTAGVRLAVDDFGTGYSSLSYLKRFPLDRLKIDRSFIQDLPADLEDAAITRAIIDMAGALGLDTVAEGVETEAQREFLLRHGCRHMQGYLMGKPMPAEDFAALLRSGDS